MKPHVLSAIEKQLGAHAVELFEKLIAMQPQKANAIIMIQGDRLDRVPLVADLYNQGMAGQVVITGNNELIGRGKRNDENDIHLLEIKKLLVERSVPGSAIIIDDASLNTKDQAVHCIVRAKKEGWNTLIAVTSPYHTIRAYLTFVKQIHDQQWKGKLIMQAAPLDWNGIPSGRSKTALEMLDVELEKIKKYSADIALVSQGLHYITTI